MSVFHNNALIGSGAGTGAAAAAEYVIPKSLRFNSGDTSYLDKTFGSAGNRKTFTFSCWLKRAKLGVRQFIFEAGSSDTATDRFMIRFQADDTLIVTVGQATNRQTSQVFRDVGAWASLIVAVDTTASTANDRIKIYWNGLQITDFSSTSNPSQNANTAVSSAAAHSIGKTHIDNSNYFDGELADIQLVDGQALAPTDFAETRSSDGVWVPKEYTGFGTNPNDGTTWSGSLTTNAGDNFDGSGAKTKAFDGSTSTKAYTANNSDGTTQNTSYIQLNSPKTFSGNLKVVCDNGNAIYDVTGGGSTLLATNNTGSDGALIDCGTITNADKIRVLMAGGSRPAIAAIYIDGHALLDGARDNSFHLNFSDSSTNEALGFDSAPTIPDLDPKKGMDVITYTGNGGTQNVGGALFEPGLVWTKMRNASGYSNKFVDSVRGATKSLVSNNTNAELTEANGVKNFNPDGFTLGSQEAYNKNNNTFVAWLWRAGGPAVPNTAGTITSEVSANTDYGFSIVKYSGTGTQATVGHGLTGQTPKFIIVKRTDSTGRWAVYYDGMSTGDYIYLDLTDATSNDSAGWPALPTSSLFTISTNSNWNNSSGTYVAYVWSEVSNYSKFGSWTGTGSAGLKVTTGFKPRWILIKKSNGSADWLILDTERGTDLGAGLYPNQNYAEASYDYADLLDDGFTLNTGDLVNANGDTYIYAAFADRPGNNWDVNNIVTNEGLTTSKTQFDVVTYTGNGGTQVIGGEVYSSTSSVAVNNSNSLQAGSLAGVFNGTQDANSSNAYGFTNGAMDFTWTPGTAISYSSKVRVWTGFGGGSVYLNGGSAVSTQNNNWTTLVSGSSGTITSIRFTVGSGGGWWAGLEVDDVVLTDGSQPGLQFKPDLVWLKARSVAYSHQLYDSIRGVQEAIVANTNAAEATYSGGLTAFNSNGFALGNDGGINNNNDTFVAWCWKAGGTAVSNTDGTITSSVSAGDGFSVVTWTGTASAGTIGHGLNGKVPKFIITKRRDSTGDWYSQHASLGATHRIQLNSNSAATSGTSLWNSTGPTDSVFSVGADNEINASGGTFVAYCFADSPGLQRVGKYSGNGSSTGPVIVTGFQPRWVLIKRTDSAGNWGIYDTERHAPIDNNLTLLADTSGTESVDNNKIDILANGFQPKNSTPNINASGGTYIYLAIGDDEIGSDEDCLVDVPNAVTADADATDTTGGYQRGNYATLNPLHKGSSVVLANGNLNATSTSATSGVGSTIGMLSGKFYCEVTVNNVGTETKVGVGKEDALTSEAGSTATTWAYINVGDKMNSNSHASYGSSFTTGDVVGIAFDADGGNLYFYKNGVAQNSGTAAYTGLTSGPYFFHVTVRGSNDLSVNFGQMRFKYPMPSGYAALNTTALPPATIADGSAQFEAITYTGTSATKSFDNFSFSPDLAWIKTRSVANDHNLVDTLRGAPNILMSNKTDSEITNSTDGFVSFDSNGFTLGANTLGTQSDELNDSGVTYAGWIWNAGANSNKTYTVKVVSDSGNKYRFDDFGTSAVTLDLAEGSTYVFDQSDSSNAGHPLRFSTTSDGTHGSGSEYTTGVTTTGTPGSAGAKTTLVLPAGTTWSDNIVATASGFQSGFGADKMFDGNVSTYGQGNSGTNPSTLVFTPPTAITFTDKVEIWHVAGDSSITAGINGGTKSAITNGSWQTVASGGGTLTTLDISRSTSGGVSLAGVRIDGVILQDNNSTPTLYYYCTNHSGMGGQANTNSTAGSSNFDGTGQCTLKANPEAGFSIAEFTGDGSTKAYGHGLNAVPQMVVVKGINHSAGWSTYHEANGNTKSVGLHATSAAYTSSVWNNTSPTTTVTTISGGYKDSGNTNLVLSFTSVVGFSAIGSYTGNGSTSDGPFVFTGFEVGWLMVKRTDGTGSWIILDKARNSYNLAEDALQADSNNAENSGWKFDLLSNGFKARANGTQYNASGGNYIYLAFASNPFSANGGLAR